jgi:hypothetical protein
MSSKSKVPFVIPILVISIGVFLLISLLPGVPKPGWFAALPTPAPTAETPKKLGSETTTVASEGTGGAGQEGSP